jgi:hypothetical protein
VAQALVFHVLAQVRRALAQVRHPIDHVDPGDGSAAESRGRQRSPDGSS